MIGGGDADELFRLVRRGEQSLGLIEVDDSIGVAGADQQRAMIQADLAERIEAGAHQPTDRHERTILTSYVRERRERAFQHQPASAVAGGQFHHHRPAQ
jgi:hypothetical protein